MNFGKSVLASALGSALSFFLVGIVLVLILVGLITSAVVGALGGEDGPVKVKDNSILHIRFDGPVQERANDKGGQIDFTTFQTVNGIGLNHFIDDIQKAKDDDRIKGIFLEPSGVMASPSTMQDLREALVDFRESGKWIVAFAEGYGQGAYYLASAADQVYLYPEGSVDFYGLSTELMFFKRMLDKLGVDVQVIRGPNNKYKSAVEGFIREDMSPENREQIETFLNDIWGIMLNDMAQARNVTTDHLNGIADNLLIRLPEHAVEYKLVDGLMYRDQVMDLLLERSGLEADEDAEDEKASEEDASAEGENDQNDQNANNPARKNAEDKLRFVELSKYHKAKLNKDDDSDDDDKRTKDKIAVVYAVGAIESGRGDDQTIGSERIAEALREARTDKNVKAVVLRVNSPGGSALASDVIWRETKLIKEAGKPFVVSMGDLAASGGYYIAAGADKIYANATTITGSIGVFGMIPNMESMLEDKIGFTFDRAKTNEHGSYMTVTRPLDEAELAAINESVTDIYTTFISLVAEGRGMSIAEVDSIAQGRVWTGVRAKEIGLVDELGDLEAAIDAAAELAGLEDYKLRELPKMVDPFEEFMKGLSGDEATARILEAAGLDARYTQAFLDARKMVQSKERVYARLPYHIVFE
ncbi:MAG: signal peptide peptidase SppA [Flavobacteriales bacterium]